jgi:O-antigen ligase
MILCESRKSATLAIVATAAVAPFVLWYMSARLNTEPSFVLIAGGGMVLALVLMRKWPMILLTGLMFVGNFKNAAAAGMTLSDPTIVLLLLTSGAVLIDVLYVLSGTEEWRLSTLFAGQGTTILLFVLFTVVFISSLTYSPDINYGTLKASRFVTFEVFSFLAPLLLLKNSTRLRQFVIATTLLSVALVIRDILQLIHASERVMQGNADITRIGDGMLFAITILIAVYRGVTRSRIVNYAVIGILVAGMIASAARSPLFALLITILISVCTVRSNIVSRKKILIGIAIIALVGTIALQCLEGLPWVQDKVSRKEAELLSFAEGSAITGGTINERLSYNASALDAATRHPVFGLGLGGWAPFYSKDEVPRFPHNFLVEVAAEQGLIGFVLLTALLAMLFRAAHRIRHRIDLGFLFPVFTFSVIYNMMTGDIENRQLWFWFGMIAAGSRMALVHTATPERHSEPISSPIFLRG